MKHTIDLHKQRIPRSLLILDAIGAVLVAIGVLELLQVGPQLVPAALEFPGIGIVLVITGSLVMLAVPLWLLRRRRHRHEHDAGHGGKRPRA
ncbi:MAG: hypothetical protein ACNA8J_02605 [Gammaproteobacteria bacterium]